MVTMASSSLTGGMYSSAAGGYQLLKLLLTPEAAAADVGMRDVYEYLSTQVRDAFLSFLVVTLNRDRMCGGA